MNAKFHTLRVTINWILAITATKLDIGTTTEQPHFHPAILDQENALPDFSFAGYQWGENEIPTPQIYIEAEEFGAIPDDDLDDTAAIRRALESANSIQRELEQTNNSDILQSLVAVRLPPGTLHLSDIIYLDQRGVSLIGSDTRLIITKPLQEVNYPDYLDDKNLKDAIVDQKKYSHFSWLGGFIWVEPSREQSPLNSPKIAAIRGMRFDKKLKVENASSLVPGDLIQLNWYNVGEDNSLIKHVCGSDEVEPGANLTSRREQPKVTQTLKVLEIEGDTLHVKEPLLHDVRTEWNCQIQKRDQQAMLTHVGVENLQIVFPADSVYQGHHFEEGYNGIYMVDAYHSWIRNVQVSDADSAFILEGCNLSLLDSSSTGRGGHYGVHVGGEMTLVDGFHCSSPDLHTFSVNTFATRNVFRRCQVWDPQLDQHAGLNHQNLFEQITIVKQVEPKSLIPLLSGENVDNQAKLKSEFGTEAKWTTFGPLPRSAEPIDLSGIQETPTALEYVDGGQTKTQPPQFIKAKSGSVNLDEAYAMFAFSQNEKVHVMGEIRDYENIKKQAYLFHEFEVSEEGELVIGFGVEWWGALYLDGEKLIDRYPLGNQRKPVSPFNHIRVKEVAAGSHLLSIQCTAGLSEWKICVTLNPESMILQQRVWEKGGTMSLNIFKSGGADDWMPRAGGLNTFWNLCFTSEPAIETAATWHVGSFEKAYQGIHVGFHSSQAEIEYDYSPEPYREHVLGKPPEPASLYQSQLSMRQQAAGKQSNK